MKPNSRHLNNYEEVWGDLGEVVPVDKDTVSALIGSQAILLPASLKLPPSGHHIFVLRLDGKHYVRRAEQVRRCGDDPLFLSQIHILIFKAINFVSAYKSLSRAEILPET